ncbi:MAG TPA: GNAT family protein [Chthoniobacteraceae bacterium]|nr:GNAT family protein [Chthoniobacteraceae bacterium]
MTTQGAATPPTMQTARLRLRPLSAADVPGLTALVEGDRAAAADLLPFFSEPGMVPYLEHQQMLFEEHAGILLGVETAADRQLCGALGLRCDFPNRQAEVRFWIADGFRHHGYATEALRCLVGYSFGYFRINRIHTSHLASQPAAGRVLEKIGFPREGRRREHRFVAGRGLDDVIDYGILLHEWAEVAHRET